MEYHLIPNGGPTVTVISPPRPRCGLGRSARSRRLAEGVDQLLLRVDPQLAVDGEQVIAYGARAEEQSAGDCRDPVAGGQPADDVQLPGGELAQAGKVALARAREDIPWQVDDTDRPGEFGEVEAPGRSRSRKCPPGRVRAAARRHIWAQESAARGQLQAGSSHATGTRGNVENDPRPSCRHLGDGLQQLGNADLIHQREDRPPDDDGGAVPSSASMSVLMRRS